MFLCAIIVTMWLGSSGAPLSQTVGSQEMSLDAFMKIDESKRRAVFAGLTPENRARLKREHATRWLRTHRPELSPRQIAAVEQAILFLTPEVYANPDAPGLRAREEKVIHDLSCALGKQAAAEAFAWSTPEATSFRKPNTLDDWLAWFSDCVVK
jgi:hypothetical protein